MRLHNIALLFALSIGLPAIARSLSVNDYPEIERYVGAERLPVTVEPWQYTSEGNAYLDMTADCQRVAKYDIKSGKEIETVLDLGHTRETTLDRIEGFSMSPDGSKLLLWLDSRNIYRRSTDAVYYVYEIRTRQLKPLSTAHPRQQAPLFSPDGRMVAFVADNNIFVKKLDYGTEIAVTTDGKNNAIINGVPDWTYEEEFATISSMTWAPDNLTLCFLKYNETEVPTFTFQLYEGACDRMRQYALYPGGFSYKYPVAGQSNSKVTLHSYDIETRKTKQITLPGTQTEYIPRIAYGPSADNLMVITLNRNQTRMELYSVNPRSTTVKSLLVEQWEAWLSRETYTDIRFLKDFFVVNSCRSGYQHLYAYSYSGVLQRQITSGDYDVDAYYGYDSATGCHYYRSAQTGAINRVVCRIDTKGRVTMLSPEKGVATAQSWSPGMDYFVLNYSNATTAPAYTLVATSSARRVRTLEDNAAYQQKWSSAPKPEFFTMQSDGYTLNGFMIKPSGFDPSRRYPVIMCQYSGPESQEVLDRWRISAENYFARTGYLVVCVDGRGTAGRGRAFSDAVYKNLGYYESIDQIAAARYAAALPFADSDRIAIYGWSYGGYESIMAASQKDAPYAAAIAVAPVTDWRYYDTVYAERYMLTPQQNPEGYRQSSTMTHIAGRRCPLLIMSGTADDNVHLFNTIQYSAETEAAGRWVDVVLFPNMNHSINGCNTRQVVFARMLNFLETNM